jgi:hypothetical protein
MAVGEELFLPHAYPIDRIPLATQVRGTVILSSMRSLRSRGLVDRYMAELDPAEHETVAALTGVTWLPIRFAMAHYGALDRLDLAPEIIRHIGAESGRFVNQTVLRVVARLTREAGATPWTALAQSNTLNSRTWIGSSMAVYKLGPKDARLDWVGLPVARFEYYREAFGAFAAGILGLFARTVHVHRIPERTNDTELSYRFSWV